MKLARSALPEEDVPRRLDIDGRGDGRIEGEGDGQTATSAEHVDQSLDDADRAVHVDTLNEIEKLRNGAPQNGMMPEPALDPSTALEDPSEGDA